MTDKINIGSTISFKPKQYKLVKELNRGGFGVTVLLEDLEINEKFVSKKYSPSEKELLDLCFDNFVTEIKLLYKTSHKNIVRVFDYSLYSGHKTGYILMEYIDGSSIDKYIQKFPEKINDVFEQTIKGFLHLEELRILHRDIRPQNIMVTNNGVVKIIDFGFGKKVESTLDYQKSFSLNWQYDTPEEFLEQSYSFKTDLYFVGKLFEKIIEETDVKDFKHLATLQDMTLKDPSKRISSFNKVNQAIVGSSRGNFTFTEDDKVIYKNFSNALCKVISKIETSSKFNRDNENILKQLEELHTNTMLENILPNNSELIKIFISGEYFYNNSYSIDSHTIESFIEFFYKTSKDKKNILLNNLYNKLDSLEKYEDDEFPF